MKVKKPIVIVGVGRSGSTAFHEMFSLHPNVAWLSGWCHKFPDKPLINRFLMKAIDFPLPIAARYIRSKFKPVEPYPLWEYYCKGFSTPCRDLLPDDVTNKKKEDLRNVMSKMLTNKRNRLLIKITGWPRIGFLHEIFDDAKFIHILRDGRAVVNSIINVEWWLGWRGPQGWRGSELTQSQREEWDKYNKSFIALACIEWKILMDAFEQAKRFIDKDDLLEIKYEDLCSGAVGVFRDVIEFCELKWSREFEDSIKNYELRNTNNKWQKELTIAQQKMIEDILHDHLERYDYSDFSINNRQKDSLYNASALQLKQEI